MNQVTELETKVKALQAALAFSEKQTAMQAALAAFAIAVARKQHTRIGELEAKLLATGGQPLVVEECESHAVAS